MLDTLAGSWLTIVLRGAAAILFGLVALVTPQLTLDRLTTLFAAYAVADGVLALLVAARTRRRDPLVGRLSLTTGIAGAGLGALALVWPGLTLLALLLLIAARALVDGIASLTGAVHLRRDAADARLLGAAGFASVVFGLALVVFPAAGVLGLLWWIVLFAIGIGGLLVALGVRLRRPDGGERGIAVAA